MALPGAPPLDGLEPPRTPLDVMLGELPMCFIKQSVEIFGGRQVGFDANLSYALLNDRGEKVGKAAETSSCCSRQCLGGRRPFGMTVW
jgi:hypothetical protein